MISVTRSYTCQPDVFETIVLGFIDVLYSTWNLSGTDFIYAAVIDSKMNRAILDDRTLNGLA